jgi:23S rRNA (pseudouridine1915-N3)-methyltransferase
MLRISFIWVDKTRETWIKNGIQGYLRRIGLYMKVQAREVRSQVRSAKMDAKEALSLEAQSLLKALPEGAFSVALDQRGRMLDSPGLAGFLTDLEEKGVRDLAMFVGGHLGLAPVIVERANTTLSLSRMTFTHEMARLILVEQIYRACTIRAGEPYHH